MVREIPVAERRMMTGDEINEAFDGKWVFMIHVTLDPFMAMPVIEADDLWEDHESGIYEQLKNDENSGATMHLSLLKNHADMLGHY